MGLEVTIENHACRRIFEELGVTNIKLTPKGRIGYPDRLFWVRGGRPTLIEFKKVGEKPKPFQKKIHADLRKLGYNVYWTDSVQEAFDIVKNDLFKAIHERI